jgi:hypothetical protein
LAKLAIKMFKFKFKSLTDAFSALLLAYNGEKVLLEVPENLNHIKRDIRIARFIDDTVFRIDKRKNDYTFSELSDAAEKISKISPNTFYTEKIYALSEKNSLRDFANHFRKKSYRSIYDSSDDIILKENYNFDSKYTLKSAPAYRCNYTRLAISLIKTLRDLGSDYVITDTFSTTEPYLNEEDNILPTEYEQYLLKTENSPLKSTSLYIPNGIYMYHRCNDFYISVENTKALENFLPSVIKGYDFQDNLIIEKQVIPFYEEDWPLEAYVLAELCVKMDLKRDLKDLSGLRLHDSNFKFSPSVADVIGYSDYNFDLVKRMGIDVNSFKNATFDFGTAIEDIINTTYDLYPKYHNGQKSFEEAIRLYKENELK